METTTGGDKKKIKQSWGERRNWHLTFENCSRHSHKQMNSQLAYWCLYIPSSIVIFK